MGIAARIPFSCRGLETLHVPWQHLQGMHLRAHLAARLGRFRGRPNRATQARISRWTRSCRPSTRGCSARRAKAALRPRTVALSRTCRRAPGSMGWASSSILDASRAVRSPARPRPTRLAVRRSRAAARHPSCAAGVQVRRQHLAHQVSQNHRLLPPTAAFRTAAMVCGGRGAPSRFHA